MIFWTIFPFSNIAYEPNATAHVSIYDQTYPISKGCRTPDFCLSKKSTLSVFVPLKKFRDSPVFWQLKSLKNKCPRNKCITKMWLKILVRTIACVLTWDAGEFNLDATKKKEKARKVSRSRQFCEKHRGLILYEGWKNWCIMIPLVYAFSFMNFNFNSNLTSFQMRKIKKSIIFW